MSKEAFMELFAKLSRTRQKATKIGRERYKVRKNRIKNAREARRRNRKK